MKKKDKKGVPCTKAMVQRSQAAERRILMNKQFMDPDEARLCQRLKEYYAQELKWAPDPLAVTDELTYKDRYGNEHKGVPRFIPYLVELRREHGICQRMHEWSQVVRVYAFAAFGDGYNVGLRLDIPLLLLLPERPQALVQHPPLGNLNVLPYDEYEGGLHLVMRYHPILGCFVVARANAGDICTDCYADEFEQEYLFWKRMMKKKT